MGIGKISEFNVESGHWDVYCERLEMYFKVNDVKEDAKVPTLITVVGDVCYELMVNLASPKKPSELSFVALVELVKSHLNPKPSILAERYRFRLRRQHNGESISQYVAELKKLSRSCEFKTNLDENLRDQFVCGVSSDIIRQRLFAKDEISFSNALKLACVLEAAEKNAAAVEPSGSGVTAAGSAAAALGANGAEASAVHALGTARGRYGGGGRARAAAAAGAPAGQQRGHHEQLQSTKICEACGVRGHTKEGCRYRHFECSKCRKMGHLRRVCPEKDRPAGGFMQRKTNTGRGNLNYNVTTGATAYDKSEDEYSSEVEEFHQLSLNGYKPV